MPDRRKRIIRWCRVVNPLPARPRTSRHRTGVIYGFARASGQLEVGVRGSNPFVPYVRAPYRYHQPLPWKLQARVNQEFYWRDNEDQRGLASELELERPLTANTLVRLTASAESNTRMREANRDWRWSQSLRWFWRIKKRAALQAGVRVNGNSEPVLRAESRRFSIRLRHSFWRPWLYVELEPYVFQKRNDNFRSVHGVALRLEAQLGDHQ